MSRDVPYDPDEICEICEAEGCFLFPYLSLCPKCAKETRSVPEEVNNEEKRKSAHRDRTPLERE